MTYTRKNTDRATHRVHTTTQTQCADALSYIPPTPSSSFPVLVRIVLSFFLHKWNVCFLTWQCACDMLLVCRWKTWGYAVCYKFNGTTNSTIFMWLQNLVWLRVKIAWGGLVEQSSLLVPLEASKKSAKLIWNKRLWMLFIRTKCNMQIFRVMPFIKQQNDT